MQHRKAGRKFGRVRRQRKALVNGLLASLILHERMTTTEAKAKETKNFIDQLINKAKRAFTDESRKLSLIRQVRSALPSNAADKLLSDFRTRFDGRESGYTRIVKLEARKSDGARMAVIEFV